MEAPSNPTRYLQYRYIPAPAKTRAAQPAASLISWYPRQTALSHDVSKAYGRTSGSGRSHILFRRSFSDQPKSRHASIKANLLFALGPLPCFSASSVATRALKQSIQRACITISRDRKERLAPLTRWHVLLIAQNSSETKVPRIDNVSGQMPST